MSFMGDVVVFGKTSLNNTRHMLMVIDIFCQCSNPRINYTKSQFIVGNNISPKLRHFLTLDKSLSAHDHTLNIWDFLLFKTRDLLR